MLINFQNSCKFKLETNGINWKGVVVSTRGPILKRISSWLSLHIGRRWLEWRWLRLTERLAAIFRILRLDAEIRHRYYTGETMTFQQSRGWSAVHRHLLGTTTLSQFLEFCPCDRSNLHNFALHLFYSILFYSILFCADMLSSSAIFLFWLQTPWWMWLLKVTLQLPMIAIRCALICRVIVR